MRTNSLVFAVLFILMLASCEKTFYCVCNSTAGSYVTNVIEIQAKSIRGAGNICSAKQDSLSNVTCFVDNYPP